MGVLTQPLRGLQGFAQIKKDIEEHCYPIGISGCVDSQKGHLISNLAQEAPCRLLLTYREEKAAELYEDLCFFDSATVLFPGKDLLFYNADIHSNHTVTQRMKVMERLISGESLTVVACIDVLMERMISREEFCKNLISIDQESVVETDALKLRLVELGYVAAPLIENPGEFSIRGDIIDIFPLTLECPVRIELWGDEVDSIRSFDPESQRSIENLDHVTIYPATEVILKRGKIHEAIKRMTREYEDQEASFLKDKKRVEKKRLKSLLEMVRDQLESFGTYAGSESLLSYFYEDTVSFLSYFPEDTMIFLDESRRVFEKTDMSRQEFHQSMENRIEGGYILPGQAKLTFLPIEIIEDLLARPLICLDNLHQTSEFPGDLREYVLNVRSVPSYQGSFEQLIKDLALWKKKKYQVILMSSSPTRARRLAADIREYDLLVWYGDDPERELAPGEIMVTNGRLRSGFEYPEVPFVVLTEKDIFKDRRKKKHQRYKDHKGKKIASLSEISVGDYVVHERYGLGIYRGIEQIESDGSWKDFINIEYKDASNLFIPADQLSIIQKYASAGGGKPRLNSLGGNEWNKTKAKVRSQIQIAARELLELYAQRQSKKGFSYGEDTVWQTEFEELFPFEETQDQLIAIEETKKDMESDRIMDRLICGDVGYGKTEIAIRAAFKAVMDSKQVVYLVPTTILAQQHYNTFRERMEHYPIDVRMLSRFCTAKETKEIKEGLKNGSVDIVIGTHKVLSKTVEYKNLGLLIIDEEQRFGVRQKEKIKQLKKEVDVLCLSATPIPRTLHMSLAGIRDMSLLEVPPVDRRAIQTYVMEFNEEMVREAIDREVSRGGQVYYVYNRVNGIEEVAAKIQQLMPDMVVEYAHGQMKERQLENIMLSFINKEIDVLVCTTIIETGLDIPNANTIIIHDAHKFGLSQLYQLRGRVGRSNRTAYAFLMYRRNAILKEEAEKRLRAIREFTDLGSGFKIAMRDLEIRGAGNLLGAEQSGHMEAVGYDLYCKMLNETVQQMKGEKEEEETFTTSIDLLADAYIPSSYIPGESQKLEFYKRISYIENQEEYEDLMLELIDRYGDVPDPMVRLMDIALLKTMAHEAFLLSVEQRKTMILFTMNPKAKVRVEMIDGFLKQYRGKMKIKPGVQPVFAYDPGPMSKKELIPHVKEVISEIKHLIE